MIHALTHLAEVIFLNTKTTTMETENKSAITIENSIKAPIEKVSKFYTEPDHIKKWNSASEDWHTTHSENDLKVGGKFLSRMEAKDVSFGFDFGGIYDVIRANECIEYTLGDGRKVEISFFGRGK